MGTLIGIFEAQNVDKVLNALHRNGFGDETIKVLDKNRQYRDATPVEGNPGLIAPVTAGQFGSAQIAINPLAALSLGASATNDLGNSLNGIGITDEETRVYQDAIKNGGTVIVIQADNDKIAQARPIFEDANGSSIAEANTGLGAT